MELKIPPHSMEAEQALIGAVLTVPAVWDDVSYLSPLDLYREEHRRFWQAFHDAPRNRDMFALFDLCRNTEEKVYVGELVRTCLGAHAAKMHAEIIKERAVLRRQISAARKIEQAAWTMSANDALAVASSEVAALTETSVIGSGPVHVSELCRPWVEEYKDRASKGGKLVGLSTGFHALDARWGGMRGGQMIVIAGRPGQGKSNLSANIASYVSRAQPALIYNLEMSSKEIIDRAIASFGPISLAGIRNGTIERANERILADACAGLMETNLWIDDTPIQTLDSIRMNTKSFVKRYGKGVIVLDYLQLVKGQGSAYERVTELSRGVKLLAKEVDCPILCLVQMNRQIDSAGRKPILSDLRDSGAIEQDADIVAFCHREDDKQEWTEIVTAKNRSGETGIDYLRRDFQVARFQNLPEGWKPPEREERKTKRALK